MADRPPSAGKERAPDAPGAEEPSTSADQVPTGADLSAFVQNLLNTMQSRFQGMSDSLVKRIDDMGGRVDDLEKAIGDLITQASADDADSRSGSLAPGGSAAGAAASIPEAGP